MEIKQGLEPDRSSRRLCQPLIWSYTWLEDQSSAFILISPSFDRGPLPQSVSKHWVEKKKPSSSLNCMIFLKRWFGGGAEVEYKEM